MQEPNKFCPECGEQLTSGELIRIKSGIDIACHTCGTEIVGEKHPPEEQSESQKESVDIGDNIGEKIKTGIMTFVKKTKEWAEEMGFRQEKKSTNDYSDEDSDE